MELNFITKLLFEMSYDELYTNTVVAFPNTHKRQHIADEVRVMDISYVPYVPNRVLQIQTTTSGTDSTHKQQLMLSGVDFSGNIPIPGHQNVSILPFNDQTGNMKVKCTCSDFFWRFATWNAAANSLIGTPPPPYIKKTNRPPVNPTSSPGICKHLISVMERIKRDGLVK